MKPTKEMGIRLYEAKRYEKALEELLSLESDPAEDSELSYFLGLCYTQLERWDEALLYLEQVVTNNPNILLIYQSRLILSYIYTRTRRLKLALFELEELLKAGFESVQVYSVFGFVLYEQREVDQAIGYFKKALELDLHNTNALNSLGFIMAEENMNLNKALELCKRAVDKKPNNPAYLDSLGWAYYKNGRKEEARACLRKALDLSSGNKVIAAHLKEVMEKNR